MQSGRTEGSLSGPQHTLQLKGSLVGVGVGFHGLPLPSGFGWGVGFKGGFLGPLYFVQSYPVPEMSPHIHHGLSAQVAQLSGELGWSHMSTGLGFFLLQQ